MHPASDIIAILLLPLTGFVFLGLFGRRYIGRFSGMIATILILLGALAALSVAWDNMLSNRETPYFLYKVLHFTWLSFGPDFSIDMNFLLDPLSLMMTVVVTLVSLMVHLFSLGYMKGETRYPTYFAFLGLFTFSMLGLVLSDSLLQMYMFWELVGCSSYLLIGFYYDRPSAVAAAKKAFIVTRFADLGFLIGILILVYQAKNSGHHDPLSFRQMISALSARLQVPYRAMFLGFPLISWGLLLVFIGGAGKSALFPLHIWLPDAMEGPTPVSALIHAATMVVAGVFLVARLYPLYAIAIDLSRLIMYIGAISALLAAIIACTQTDIKRILAYSTMSQIGYMMFALGTAPADYALGFTASMFHLFTHACFKALLFLCAGVIIHHVHSNEMKDTGGLRKQLPLAHLCFLIACLSIAGIPPFSGFFSKEDILLAAWKADKLIYAIGLFTSSLTAFYMFRLYFSVFWNRPATGHRHKLPFVESLPLILLAIGTVFMGFLPFSELVPADPGQWPKKVPAEGIGLNAIPPVLMALTGIAIAARLYYRESDRPAKAARAFRGFYKAAMHKFYIDEAYIFITKKVIFNCVGRPAAWIDRNIVDGSMNGLASLTARISTAIKGVQSGKVQDYAWFFFIGIAGLAVLFIYIIT